MAAPRPGSVTGVLLAAGLSSRFAGEPKQLADWFGRPLVAHAATILRVADVDRVLVVLGHRADVIANAVKGLAVEKVVNRHFERGRGTSIRTAVDRLGTAAALFMLCDQPFVDASVIDLLIRRYRDTGAEAVAPRYGTERGSPVLFDRSVFPALAELGDDEGGRRLLDHLRVERVPIDDTWVSFDIDTVNDLERARAEQLRRQQAAPDPNRPR